MMVALTLAFVGAMVASTIVLALLMPLFRAYALARPNARSSHRAPVPQGGGIGILIGGLGVGLVVASLAERSPAVSGVLLASALAMGLLGACDDLVPLSWRLRLGVQAMLVTLLLVAMPPELRLAPWLPLLVERAASVVLGLWFVNLVNFMDGIDGLLVIGLAPLTLAIGTGFLGIIPSDPFAMAISGALLGFLLFNWPPARLFAGDVGSLAVGLIVAYLLFVLASRASLVASLILPLHFLCDATTTLVLRASRKQNLTQAHRDHAYQRAFDAGMSNRRILGEVAVLNAGLAGLAGLAISYPLLAVPALALGLVLTSVLLWHQRRRGR
ncbi:Rfe UDP-N-acetylmuramyl pentapeptide phosphotransferase/UDP-N- acetylglucosamine-1-phosphate transferase [Rhabdaerophilaceae bacterium]